MLDFDNPKILDHIFFFLAKTPLKRSISNCSIKKWKEYLLYKNVHTTRTYRFWSRLGSHKSDLSRPFCSKYHLFRISVKNQLQQRSTKAFQKHSTLLQNLCCSDHFLLDPRWVSNQYLCTAYAVMYVPIASLVQKST